MLIVKRLELKHVAKPAQYRGSRNLRVFYETRFEIESDLCDNFLNHFFSKTHEREHPHFDRNCELTQVRNKILFFSSVSDPLQASSN